MAGGRLINLAPSRDLRIVDIDMDKRWISVWISRAAPE
jgi:hypothetical protein